MEINIEQNDIQKYKELIEVEKQKLEEIGSIKEKAKEELENLNLAIEFEEAKQLSEIKAQYDEICFTVESETAEYEALKIELEERRAYLNILKGNNEEVSSKPIDEESSEAITDIESADNTEQSEPDTNNEELLEQLITEIQPDKDISLLRSGVIRRSCFPIIKLVVKGKAKDNPIYIDRFVSKYAAILSEQQEAALQRIQENLYPVVTASNDGVYSIPSTAKEELPF